MTKRLLVVVGALLAVLLGGVAGAGPASAHAALVRSDPKDGSVVATAPGQVRLWFSEGVLLSADSVKVLAPDGSRADSGGARHIGSDGSTARTPLRAGLADGTYVVAWKAVSADSHPVAGAFTFSIGAPSKTSVDIAQERQAAGGGVVGVLYGLGRYVSYSGYAVLVGGCVFLAGCWPRGTRLPAMRRLTATGWAMLVGGTIALLMLRAPYANGGGLGQALDLGLVRSETATGPGAALVSRLLLLAAAALVISLLFGSYARDTGERRQRGPVWGLGIGGGLVATGLAATWALSEHASVGIQPGVAMPVDIVHLLAMAVWLGGQAALLTALRATGTVVDRGAVLRFSRIAFAAVCLLAATGVYQSWRQVGSWKALFGTDYGRLLVVKVSLVAVMLALARFSRRWTHRLADVPPAPAGRSAEPEPPSGAGKAAGGPAPHTAEDAAGTKTGAETESEAETEGTKQTESAARGAGQPAATGAGGADGAAGAEPGRFGAGDAAEPPKAKAGADAATVLDGEAEAEAGAATARGAGQSAANGAAGAEPRRLGAGDAAEPARAKAGAGAATARGAGHPAATEAGGADGADGAGGAEPRRFGAGDATEPATAKAGADAATVLDGEAEAGAAAESGAMAGAASGATAGTTAGGAGGSGAPRPRPGAAAPVSPERAAQLARQAAATAKARARREREVDVERGGLRRSVLAEAAVAVAVLAVTTVLTGTQPGRTAEEQAAAAGPVASSVPSTAPGGSQVDVTIPFDTGGPNGTGEAELTIAPARSGGANVLHVLITGPGGRPLDVPEVDVAFTLKAKKIGPIPVALGKVDIGHWSADAVSLPFPGRWTASVTVRTSDIDEVTETASVAVGP